MQAEHSLPGLSPTNSFHSESAAERLDKENRVRLPNIFLEENNLHAVMDYMEEDI
jgi:hypothetical protein